MPRPDIFFAIKAPSKESFGLDARFRGQTWAYLAVRRTLEAAGVEFIDDKAHQHGKRK